nr:VPLPA-CTERM sorting domain-containing protein [Rubellimicrobium arenae]
MIRNVTNFAALAFLFLAGSVQAATISEGSSYKDSSTLIDLNPADFVGSGRCGYGDSVINDGCSVTMKSNPYSRDAYGRYDPWGGTWIDSQDLSDVIWTVEPGRAFQILTFALTDAFDQPVSELLGESFFTLSVDDAEWTIDAREANGTLHWITVAFDKPTTSANVHFSTRLNDGWGIKAAMVTVAPVPLPAAGWLGLAGLAGLVALGRRKRS